MKKNDKKYMNMALDLAVKGMNTCMPNPRVGCVIVKNDKIIGQGWHRKTGEAHAEIMALNNAGEDAHNSTVYITLEPCNHKGKTPPCIDALIKASVKRVVFSINDPNPSVHGKSKKILESEGIEVIGGLLEEKSKNLNLGFIKRMTSGTPYVRTKIAASLDGRTSLKNGISKWITSEESRKDVQSYRARSCAILTSSATVLIDNPSMNVRISDFDDEDQPKRIILDTSLRITGEEAIFKPPGEKLIYTLKNTHNNPLIKNMIRTMREFSGKISLTDVIEDLGSQEVNELLIEAGPILNGAFLSEGLVDEVVLYLAPCFLGDKANAMFKLPILSEMSERFSFKINDISQIGPDIKIILRK